MALGGWLVDKSVAARATDPKIAAALAELAGKLFVCPVGELEQLFSARSAEDYEQLKATMADGLGRVDAPHDVLEQALGLQRDLAHHHGMWHRTPIPDLLIAVSGLHNNLGVLHIDGDFDRIAEVRPLVTRRLR